jgi:transcriptional regulator with XRE-family HTH domain
MASYRPNVCAMKKERAAFAERLRDALTAANIDARPVELVKLVARYGRVSVTQQAISGWLSGKHMPKQDSIRALAAVLGVEPHVLQYGGSVKIAHAVREARGSWLDDLSGPDRLAIQEFKTLSAAHRKLVREMIMTLVTAAARSGRS